MSTRYPNRSLLLGACSLLCALPGGELAVAGQPHRDVLVLSSTNEPSENQVVVFKLENGSTPALSLVAAVPTGGKGGASGNAGILQFDGDLGAVANYGSSSVSLLVRTGDSVDVDGPTRLAPGCEKPDSVALSHGYLFVAGATCAESHRLSSGGITGGVVHLPDPSAAQIAVGKSWAAVTFTSGSVVQLGLAADGGLDGGASPITLPSEANNTPLGAAFWNDILGFTPAHSPDSFAIVDAERNVFPIQGPKPPFPANAPCWVAKGPGSVWYTGNSPGNAISIFFSDDHGGAFYKSVPLPGSPTDITVSGDNKWLAAIYTEGGSGYVAVFKIDPYGDLTAIATSEPIGIAAFNGVAISE